MVIYTVGKQPIKACPPNWRLPTEQEWQELIRYFGGYYDVELSKPIGNLKESYEFLSRGGKSGFSVVFGGYRTYDGDCHFLMKIGYYWSATIYNDEDRFYYTFNRREKKISKSRSSRFRYFSCRCVQDFGSLICEYLINDDCQQIKLYYDIEGVRKELNKKGKGYADLALTHCSSLYN